MKTRYFITKTGFEMVDVCQTYGLAEVLEQAHLEQEGSSPDPPITIHDLGHAWVVEGPEIAWDQTLCERVCTQLTAPLAASHEAKPTGPDDVAWFLGNGWRYVHYTKRDKAADEAKRLERIVGSIGPRLSEAASTTGGCADGSAKAPQNLDTLLGQGVRQTSRAAAYLEDGVKLSDERWALAALGAAAVGSFTWEKVKGSMKPAGSMVPVPASVRYDSHMSIRREFRRDRQLCALTVTTKCAHFAIKLGLRLVEQRNVAPDWRQHYSAVLFQGIAPTGNQPKPSHGGLFPLELVNELVDADIAAAGDLFDRWDKLLQTAGMNKGMETLALTLTDFLMHPTLSNLERHWRTHLRFSLREEGDKKRVRTLYPEAAMEGLMAHVTA
jgi:hypothetical protein